jgi:tetratricopeptide (TPR) repeat protein
MYSREYDAAIAQFNNLIELHPDFVEPYALLNRIYLQQGRSDDFAKYFLQWGTRFGFSEKELEGYRRAYQSGGTTGLLRERRRVLVQQQNTYFRAPYIVARIHAVLGEHDQALQWLEKAMLQRDVNVDPEFDSLRSDPRFQRMLQRIGLTAPPRASALRWLPFAL